MIRTASRRVVPIAKQDLNGGAVALRNYIASSSDPVNAGSASEILSGLQAYVAPR
jgi:hypothetical protein